MAGAMGEDLEWYYVDSTGQEFGPFPSQTMRGWFQQGFFPMQGELLVRLPDWSEHVFISKLYPEPIEQTAFDGPPLEQSRSGPAPSGGGRRGGGNNSSAAAALPPMGAPAYDAMGAGLWGGMGGPMMPGAAMQGAGLAAYGFPRPGGYAPMAPFAGMPMMPGAATGRFYGRIKSFNAQKGFGFIECPEAHAIYGRDVFLHKAQISDFNIGSEVNFSVEMNKTNMPQARDITEASMDGFPGVMGMGGLPFMGGGCMGGGGKGAMGGGGGGKSGGKGKGNKGKGNKNNNKGGGRGGGGKSAGQSSQGGGGAGGQPA